MKTNQNLIVDINEGNSIKNIIQKLSLLLVFALTSITTYAEGSADLFPSTSGTGVRYWLWQNASFGSQPYQFIPGHGASVQTPHYVYAEVGERINIGHSAMGFDAGTIILVTPGGRIVRAAALGGTGTAGRIANRAEELAGPNTITAGGYTPKTFTVDSAGVYMIFLVPRAITTTTSYTANEILEGDSWTSSDQTSGSARAFILAWDITVDDGAGTPSAVDGRVFTYNMTWASRGNFCNAGSAPQFYTLTKDGIVYENSFEDLNPGAASFWVSSKGPRTEEGAPRYKSIDLYSCDTLAALSDTCTRLYPPSELDDDANGDITHKMFYNEPDFLMPASSVTAAYSTSTDYDLGVTSLTGRSIPDYWLYSKDVPNLTDFSVDSINCSTDSVIILKFHSTVDDLPYVIKIDVDSNGIFDGKRDVTIVGSTVSDTNRVYWNLNDGEGVKIGVPIRVEFIFEAKVGEVHFPFYDVERNNGGMKIERLNALTASIDVSTLFWDDTDLDSIRTGFGFSGENPQRDGTAGFLSASGGIHTFTCAWGNQVVVDNWTYADTFNFRETLYILNCPPIDTLYDTTFINDTLDICLSTADLFSTLDTLYSCSPGGLITSEGGNIILGADSCLKYIPPTDYIGNDTFCVTICDDFGICDTTIYVITVECLLTGNAVVFNPTTCNGTDGYIQIFMDAIHGVAPYNATLYERDSLPVAYGPFATDIFSLTGLSAGVYDSIVVIDANGCKYHVGLKLLNDPSSPVIDSVVFTPTDCGVCNGKMYLYMDTTSLGTPPYEVLYDSLNTGSVKRPGLVPNGLGIVLVDSGLCAGDYGGIFIISDSAGCTSGTPLGPYKLGTNGSCIDTIYVEVPKNTPIDSCIDTTELNGDVLTSTWCSGDSLTSNGKITFDGTNANCITYTPNVNFVGLDTGCVIICDENVHCDTTYIFITVTPGTDTLYDTTIVNDTLAICVDASELVGTFDTLKSCDGSLITARGGNLVMGADSCLEYVPPVDYVGNDTFCVVVCDDLGICDTTTYVITVICGLTGTSVKSDPTTCGGTDGYIRVFMDSIHGVAPYNVTLYERDSIPVAYGPFATDSFDLGGLDAGVYDSARVIDANGCSYLVGLHFLNDPNSPVIDSVVFTPTDCGACNGTMSLYMDTANLGTPPYEVLYDSLNSGIVKRPGLFPDTNGIVLVDSNLCAGDYSGILIISDAAGCTSGAPFDSFKLETNTSCIDTIYVTIYENTYFDSCVDTTDLMGTTLSSTWCSGDSLTANGKIVFDDDSANCITYTPNLDYIGQDTGCIIVCDENVVCDTTIVIVTILPLNTDTCRDTTRNTQVLTTCCADSSELTGPIDTATDCAGATSGTASSGGTYTIDSLGCVTYTPVTTYVGTDTICVVVCDSVGFCDTSIIIITVIPTPDTMYDTTVVDIPRVICIDTTALIELSGPITSIKDCTTGSTIIGASSAGGAYTIDSLVCMTYTPPVGYVGLDTFCVMVCDSAGFCDSTFIIVTVIPEPDTIWDTTSVDVPLVVCIDSALYLELSGPIVDLRDCSTSSTVGGAGSSGGSYTIDSISCITYTPAAGYVGNDTICVMVCDSAFCDSTYIIITVLPVTDTCTGLTHNRDSILLCCVDTTVLNGKVTDCAGNSTDTTINGGVYTIDSISGCVVYHPDTTFIGIDKLCLVLCDTVTGICDTTVICITVIPTPDTIYVTVPPGATDTTCVDTYEFDGGPFTIWTCDSTSYTYGGDTLIFADDTCVVFSAPPTATWLGDTVCIILCDSNGICDTTIIIYSPDSDTCIEVWTEDSLAIDNCIGDSIIAYCIPIDLADIAKYEIRIGGGLYTGPRISCTTGPGTEIELPGPDSMFWLHVYDTITGCADSIFIDIFGPGDVRCDSIVTVDDYATTNKNVPVFINILTNDTIPCGTPDSLFIITPVTRGSAILNSITGVVTYTPETDSCDYVDSFEYVACCGAICDTAWGYITVAECLPPPPEICIVNGFSPNGDGFNDTWEILPIGSCDDISIQIYNRYGNIVYEQDNYLNQWNGTWLKTGESLPDGTYYYVVTFNESCTGNRVVKTTLEGPHQEVNISGATFAGFVTLHR